jgi:nitrogen fixation protein FixH
MRIRLNWGTGIALVYTAFAAATTGFVAFAIGRPVDLVSADYYAQSLRQDQRAETARNTAALVPAPTVAQTDARTVLLSLPRAHVPAAEGTVTLYRASNASADRVQPLALDAEGRQTIATVGLQLGLWVVQVEWTVGGSTYYFEQPIVLR